MIHDPEKIIKDYFAALPRKPVPPGDKIRIWFTIQNHIRQTRLAQETHGRKKIWMFVKIAATFALVLFAVTVVAGAAKANPGETLYPVKKAAEHVEKAFASSDEAKVKIRIKHAKRRLEEVKTLVETNKESKIVSETLEALTTTTQEVHEAVVNIGSDKPELIDEAVKLASEEEHVLNAVKDSASGDIKEAVQKVIISTKESIEKLKSEGSQEVKGTAAVIEENPDQTEEAASTTESSVPVVKKHLTRPKEIIIAPVQIDSIIRVDGDDITESLNASDEPEIVPSPQ